MPAGEPARGPGDDATGALISTAALARRLGEPDLRIVDSTYFLPAMQRDARSEFADSHVPGAVFFDIDAIADFESPLPHMLPARRTSPPRSGHWHRQSPRRGVL